MNFCMDKRKNWVGYKLFYFMELSKKYFSGKMTELEKFESKRLKFLNDFIRRRFLQFPSNLKKDF